MDHRRLLSDSAPPPQELTSPSFHSMNSDFLVLVTAFSCAIICVLGLLVVSRCAWIRRLTGRQSESDSSPVPAAANKGLKKNVLNSLPKLTFTEGTAEAEKLSNCPICLTDFATGDEVRVLPQCGHGFHVICIDAWLGSHSSCPSCRQILDTPTRCLHCGKSASVPCSATAALTPARRENQISHFLP